MDADLGVGSSAALFFHLIFKRLFQRRQKMLRRNVQGEKSRNRRLRLRLMTANIKYTPMLLDGLKERGIKATFFLIGANTEQEESKKIVKRMYEEGHLIGNHTYRHVDLSKISGREAEKEIKTTDEAIKKITGHETEFIRPPFGAMPEGEEDPDKIYVKWTVDSLDWVTKDTEKIVEKVTADTKEGDVILMHDCYGESVEAALQIVDIMEKQGYEFVTADELIIN